MTYDRCYSPLARYVQPDYPYIWHAKNSIYHMSMTEVMDMKSNSRQQICNVTELPKEVTRDRDLQVAAPPAGLDLDSTSRRGLVGRPGDPERDPYSQRACHRQCQLSLNNRGLYTVLFIYTRSSDVHHPLLQFVSGRKNIANHCCCCFRMISPGRY